MRARALCEKLNKVFSELYLTFVMVCGSIIVKKGERKMGKINNYNLFAEEACELLLDTYMAKDWNSSWKDFLDEAIEEFKEEVEVWKHEDIDIER